MEKQIYYIVKKGLHIDTIEYHATYKEICNIANLLDTFDNRYIIIDSVTNVVIFSK